MNEWNNQWINESINQQINQSIPQAMDLHKLSVANLQALSVYVGCDINGGEKKADFVARLTNYIIHFQHASESEDVQTNQVII